jgi:hypothetical protein
MAKIVTTNPEAARITAGLVLTEMATLRSIQQNRGSVATRTRKLITT